MRVKEVREWIERNPLRQWRRKQGVTFMELSAMLGVNTVTLQQWETGSSQPRAENLLKLEKLLGGDLRTRWTTWKQEKPRL